MSSNEASTDKMNAIPPQSVADQPEKSQPPSSPTTTQEKTTTMDISQENRPNGPSSPATTTSKSPSKTAQKDAKPSDATPSTKREAEATASSSKTEFESTRPLIKLSVNLLKTYIHINEVYYAKKRRLQEAAAKDSKHKKEVHNNGHDNHNFDYIVKPQELIQERYLVDSILGTGSFGQVVKAFDNVDNESVAIKIIKNRAEFKKQAKLEMKFLELFKEKGLCSNGYVVEVKRQFEHQNHTCIVFELLSCNLYQLIKSTHYQGVSLNLVRKFGTQILTTLYALALPAINVIHCDLKPENILLRHPKRSLLKVVDFGSSCYVGKTMYSYVQSRFYRAPEVILGLGYSVPIDMWSLGCILVELHTGSPIFPGNSEHDQLCRIVEVCGLPPQEFIEKCPKKSRFFNESTDAEGKKTYTIRPSSTAKKPYVDPGTRLLKDVIGRKRLGESGHSADDYDNFVDIVSKMLCYDPTQRITPHEAVMHTFFSSVLANAPNPGEAAAIIPTTTTTTTTAATTASDPAITSSATTTAAATTASASAASAVSSDPASNSKSLADLANVVDKMLISPREEKEGTAKAAAAASSSSSSPPKSSTATTTSMQVS